MLGLRYLKVSPTTYVMLYRQGKVVCEGLGLSFFYFAPTASIVQVAVSSRHVPFVFNEVTGDFQDVTIQGELAFRVSDAKRVAASLDFSVDAFGRYRSDDPGKLDERLVHVAQIATRAFTERRKLKELLIASDGLVAEVLQGLRQSEVAAKLGLEIQDLSILGIKPSPEMAKALQTDAREELLRRADEAIYARRNAAVELERTIKENELNTEIAVEQKKRQIRESQMEADIAVEQQRTTLVDSRVANERKESEARAATLQAMLEPIKSLDWRTLLAVNGGDSSQVMAMAFQELAQNAAKIGELNISPDLLSTLLKSKK